MGKITCGFIHFLHLRVSKEFVPSNFRGFQEERLLGLLQAKHGRWLRFHPFGDVFFVGVHSFLQRVHRCHNLYYPA